MSNGEDSGGLSPITVKARAFFDVLFSLPTLLAVLLASCFGFIFWMVKNAGDGQGVANVDFARGLITLLFTVGTIAVALILTFMVAFDAGNGTAKDRFDRGREILALLIGIFGTILGFYFGSANVEGTSATAPVITAIEPTTVTEDSATRLVIIGRRLGSSSVVLVGAKSLATTVVDNTRLETELTADFTGASGAVAVKVVDGRLVSNEMTLTITPKQANE